MGHSWNAPQFCAGGDSQAVNIVMTELDETLAQIRDDVRPPTPVPPEFPIQVDEGRQTVTVAAGIPQRMLLEYLSEYGEGWTLPAFSYFIDQSIGGAVATGTHGSSFRHGSLSSQVESLRLMVANGTVLDISAESDPHLFKAAGVSVGRLGILMDLTLRIVPDRLVERVTEDMDLLTFAEQVKAVQDAYTLAIGGGGDADEDEVQAALRGLEETQSFWHPQQNIVWRTDYRVVEDGTADTTVGVEDTADTADTADDDAVRRRFEYPRLDYDPFSVPDAISTQSVTPAGVYDQVPNDNAVGPTPAITKNPANWGRIYPSILRGTVTPGEYAANKAYVTMSEQVNQNQAGSDPYDQYEAAVPLEIAGDCLLGLNDLVYGAGANSTVREGFRTPPLIRFVGAEDFYLSPSYGTPVMYVNLEDHLSLSTGTKNEGFDTVMRYLLDECDGRLHWGKAGWPDLLPDFDGATVYPKWCDFGCAVAELDPTSKFQADAADVWRWTATQDGYVVGDFWASCCDADGFSGACVCAPR